MDRMYFDNEFEDELKAKSDQLRMYPSDRIWNEVHRTLHTRRKRFVAGMGLLIGGILILAGSQLLSPVKNIAYRPVDAKASPITETPVSDLRDFDPNAFSSADATNRIQDSQAAVLRTPFFVNSRTPRAWSGQEPSPGIESPLAAVVSEKRSANVTASSPAQGARQVITRKEDESLQASPLIPADVSFAGGESEKPQASTGSVRNERFSWQIYVTPTINTHHLYGVDYQNINSSLQGAPITVVHFANVNGFVDNSPAMGYDVGGNLLYRLSKNFTLKAGLQFSFSRYYFRAYNSSPSQSSTALSSYYGYIADSLISAPTPRMAGNPKNPQQFQNKYYQLSVPIGFEWKVAGKGRLQLHVGGTIQPSYLLNRNAYVLSGDYNYFGKDPDVFRRWNLQAGAETFISYQIGPVRWELGPQIRYQILSTYKGSYPLQEGLVNYGIRIGFTKSIR